MLGALATNRFLLADIVSQMEKGPIEKCLQLTREMEKRSRDKVCCQAAVALRRQPYALITPQYASLAKLCRGEDMEIQTFNVHSLLLIHFKSLTQSAGDLWI
jgi:hypothetical protein